jgi:broad specificity phosphatase PhoE
MSETQRPREAYLIRHGQTEWNVQKRWQGHYDCALNAEGQRQARRLAKYMRLNHQLDHIYSSDLCRALDTAKAIGEGFQLEPQIDLRLRETHVGVFEGYTGDELKTLYPEELTIFRSGKMDFIIPTGESMLQVQTRAHEAFFDIMANTEGNVAFVSHGGWINLLLRKLFAEIDARGGTMITNTSITTLVEDDGSWRLGQLSVTPHL